MKFTKVIQKNSKSKNLKRKHFIMFHYYWCFKTGAAGIAGQTSVPGGSVPRLGDRQWMARSAASSGSAMSDQDPSIKLPASPLLPPSTHTLERQVPGS